MQMIQLDPSKRRSVKEYLQEWKKTAFPESFSTILHPYLSELYETSVVESFYNSPNKGSLPDADGKIDKLYQDYSRIVNGLAGDGDAPASTRVFDGIPNLNVGIPGITSLDFSSCGSDETASLILLSVVLSATRSVSYPSSLLKALDIILAISCHLTDSVRLYRIIPNLMNLMTDRDSNVRVLALKVTTQIVRLLL
jgi:phosphoinositide-3-kinase regulatory subunit 4